MEQAPQGLQADRVRGQSAWEIDLGSPNCQQTLILSRSNTLLDTENQLTNGRVYAEAFLHIVEGSESPTGWQDSDQDQTILG